MPYYTYESLLNQGERFEFKQSINDEPFTLHPGDGRAHQENYRAWAWRYVYLV